MAENKKYYWLKLKEDFFDEDTINWVEEQKNGKEYCLFYLKLCLKSLNNNGILIRSVGDLLIPYDTKKLAEMTNTDIDTVIVAMELFKNIGLIQILENGEIYLTQLQNMIGSETKWAEKKRIYREKQEKLKLGQCPSNVLEDIDINSNSRNNIYSINNKSINKIKVEEEINKEEEENIYDYIESNFGRTLNAIEYELIGQWEDNSLTRYAVKQAILNGKYNLKYIQSILDDYRRNNIKTVQQAQENEENFKNKKKQNNMTATEKRQELYRRMEEKYSNDN